MMRALGNLMIAAGVVVVGVTAVMRRILKPEDYANFGVGRWIVLVAMLSGGALLLIGYGLNRKASGVEH